MIKLTRPDGSSILINPVHIILITDSLPSVVNSGAGNSSLELTNKEHWFVMETLDEIHEMCLDVQLGSLLYESIEPEGEDDDDQWWAKS